MQFPRSSTRISRPLSRALRRVLHLIGDRQLANPFARGCKDRIGQRGHHARRPWLADPAWRFQTLHEYDVDSRHLVDAQHPVVAEVGLLDAAVLDGDLAVKGGRQAEDDAALHLRANNVGIHLDSTVDGAPGLGWIHGAILVDNDLHDLRDKAAETDAERDAAASAGGQRLAPSGSLRGNLQDVLRAWLLVEQSDAVGERILLRTDRELVHEALDHEGSASRSNAAPPGRVHPGGGFLLDIVDVNGAAVVGLIRRGLHRVPINTVFHRFGTVVARDDGGAGDSMRPAHRLASRIEPRADAVVIVWAVQVVLNVFLARPDHLHRPTHLLRDLHRPHGPVVVETAAESAAQQVVVN